MKKTFLIFAWLLLFPIVIQASSLEDGPKEIENKLNQFAITWNHGDINEVVRTYYIDSDSTILISANIIHGYQNILTFFQTNYPTKKEMGEISFSDIEVKMISPIYGIAIGKWASVTEDGAHFGGIFTVLYENTSEGWKIAIDSTSGL